MSCEPQTHKWSILNLSEGQLEPLFSPPRILVASLLVLWAIMALFPARGFGEKVEAVRFAYGRKIHYAPQIIAMELGYFEAQGVRVKGQVLIDGIECAEALTTGAADLAVMGDTPALFAVASGRPVKIVASYGGGESMHRIVVAKDSGIRSPRDLEGKRVAVHFGSSTHGAFLLYCQKEKVDISKIRMVNLRPMDLPEAMASAQIDAAAGSEPWPSNIELRVPGSYPLASFSGLGNEFPLMMLTSTAFAESSHDKVVAILKATGRAIELMRADPQRAAEIIGRVTGVPALRELKVIQTLKWGLRLDHSVRSSLEQTATFLKDTGKLASLPDLQKAFDDGFLKQVQILPSEKRKRTWE